MNKFSRLMALLLTLCLVLPVFAMAEEAAETPAEDLVMFSVDGEEIRWSQVEYETEYLVSAGYLEDYDYQTAMGFMVQNALMNKMVKVWGLDQFTEDELAAFQAEAQAMWDQTIEENMIYFLSEDTEEGRALARETMESYLFSMGYSVDVLASQIKSAAVNDALMAKISEGKDLAVTEAEVREVFETYAAQDQAMYEGNVGMYEMYTNYYGAQSWYVPAGFRGITHILLEVDEELMTAYTTAQAALEEEPAEGEEITVTQADVDAARDAILESCKEEIDAIYAWLENGESFENLIALYGTDPGMQDATTLAEGYAVHKDSIMWDPAFTAGAFSDKMQKPGDVSDPVVGSYGIHILYYLRDIPSGIVELSDDIYTEIETYLSTEKQNAVITEAMDAWIADAEIVYYQENINAMLGVTAE
ncbi:MAG: hypothetical protein E7324_01605 [Clostridiales bacterium]|nr:hypothetical protein [Clostridiales bacterium]